MIAMFTSKVQELDHWALITRYQAKKNKPNNLPIVSRETKLCPKEPVPPVINTEEFFNILDRPIFSRHKENCH